MSPLFLSSLKPHGLLGQKEGILSLMLLADVTISKFQHLSEYHPSHSKTCFSVHFVEEKASGFRMSY